MNTYTPGEALNVMLGTAGNHHLSAADTLDLTADARKCVRTRMPGRIRSPSPPASSIARRTLAATCSRSRPATLTMDTLVISSSL